MKTRVWPTTAIAYTGRPIEAVLDRTVGEAPRAAAEFWPDCRALIDVSPSESASQRLKFADLPEQAVRCSPDLRRATTSPLGSLWT